MLQQDITSEIAAPDVAIVPDLIDVNESHKLDIGIGLSVTFNKNGISHTLDNSNRKGFDPSCRYRSRYLFEPLKHQASLQWQRTDQRWTGN